MAGMEIFNTDDLSDDFLEIDESLLMANASEIAPTNVNDDNNDKDVDDVDKDKDVDDDGKLELLLPPSVKGDENDNGDDSDIDDSDKNIKPDSSTQNPKFFSSLVQALKEGGILEDVEDDDIKSQADFMKVMDESIKQREFADLNDEAKEYLEALRNGVPHDEIVQHQKLQANYSAITDEALEDDSENGEELRRNVIMTNFMSKGINEAKARKLTDKLVEAGEDITESKEAISELKASEKAAFEADRQAKAEAAKAREKAEKESIDTLNKIVKDTKEVIPGMNIPINIKNKIVKGLTSPVAYTEDKRPLDIISKYLHDNPIDGRFKLAYLLTVTDNMNKMDVLENKKAKRSAMKDLEESLKYKENGGSLGDSDPKFQTKFDLDNWEFQ